MLSVSCSASEVSAACAVLLKTSQFPLPDCLCCFLPHPLLLLLCRGLCPQSLLSTIQLFLVGNCWMCFSTALLSAKVEFICSEVLPAQRNPRASAS